MQFVVKWIKCIQQTIMKRNCWAKYLKISNILDLILVLQKEGAMYSPVNRENWEGQWLVRIPNILAPKLYCSQMGTLSKQCNGRTFHVTCWCDGQVMDNTFVVLIKQLWKLNIENHRHNSWKGSFNEKSTLTKTQGRQSARLRGPETSEFLRILGTDDTQGALWDERPISDFDLSAQMVHVTRNCIGF